MTNRFLGFRVRRSRLGAQLRIGNRWFCWDVVGQDYRPLFSERYAGQHGIASRRVVYIPAGFGRRWRFEILPVHTRHPVDEVAS